MKPNADGTLTVLGHVLTTAEVEQLIHDLALARNDMAPQVPTDFEQSVMPVLFQHDPDFGVSKTRDGNVGLLVRHRGLGWLVITFAPDRATFVGMALQKRGAGGPAGDLITDGGAQRH